MAAAVQIALQDPAFASALWDDGGAGGARDGGSGLAPPDVRRVVMAHVRAVRACYELEVQNTPGLQGTLRIGWRINPDGSAQDAKVIESTLASSRVEACVLRQVTSWKFPSASGPTLIASFPFKFGVTP
jgi:outer membrane biosynthesis protein TonB